MGAPSTGAESLECCGRVGGHQQQHQQQQDEQHHQQQQHQAYQQNHHQQVQRESDQRQQNYFQRDQENNNNYHPHHQNHHYHHNYNQHHNQENLPDFDIIHNINNNHLYLNPVAEATTAIDYFATSIIETENHINNNNNNTSTYTSSYNDNNSTNTTRRLTSTTASLSTIYAQSIPGLPNLSLAPTLTPTATTGFSTSAFSTPGFSSLPPTPQAVGIAINTNTNPAYKRKPGFARFLNKITTGSNNKLVARTSALGLETGQDTSIIQKAQETKKQKKSKQSSGPARAARMRAGGGGGGRGCEMEDPLMQRPRKRITSTSSSKNQPQFTQQPPEK